MTQGISVIKKSTSIFGIVVKNSAGSPYVLGAGEQLIFGVKKSISDNSYSISKALTSANYSGGEYTLQIDPSDTSSLAVGRYYYDIGLKSGANYFNIIEPSAFEIVMNVTEAG